jgi:uncharacterized membrane protein
MASSKSSRSMLTTKATATPIFTTIIVILILLVSYRYLARIELCDCGGNKKDLENMKWVDTAFIAIDGIALLLYIVFFASGTNYGEIYRAINKPLLLSLFGIYFVFVLYCAILFVMSFYDYFYNLPSGCNCDKGDLKQYVLYVQGGVYTLNLTFLAGLIIYLGIRRL